MVNNSLNVFVIITTTREAVDVVMTAGLGTPRHSVAKSGLPTAVLLIYRRDIHHRMAQIV